MPARVEAAVLGELPIELAFAFADLAGHDDLGHGEQIAGAAARLRQSAAREPQLAARRCAGRHLRGSRARRASGSRASRPARLPTAQRQVQVQVVTGRAIQAMRLERDVEIQVAIAATLETLAALAGQAQALAVDGAGRRCVLSPYAERAAGFPAASYSGMESDSDSVVPRNASSMLISTGTSKSSPGSCAVRAPNRENRSAKSASSKEKLLGSAAAMLARPIGRRAEFFALRTASQRVVGRALLGILERLVRLGDFLEPRLRSRLLGNVRMIFLREAPIGLPDLIGGSAALDSERGVVVRVLHRTPVGFTRLPWASASACSPRGFRTSRRGWLPRATPS